MDDLIPKENTYSTGRSYGLVGIHRNDVGNYFALCYFPLRNEAQTFPINLDQAHRLKKWCDNKFCAIQEIMPDFDDEQREMCISGMNNAAWNDAMKGAYNDA